MSDDLEYQRALRIVRERIDPDKVLVIPGENMRIDSSTRYPTGTVRFVCKPADYTDRAGERKRQQSRVRYHRDKPRSRTYRSRDELLNTWQRLQPRGVTSEQFAASMGMSVTAWERAFYRALAEGDPRAVRPKRGRLSERAKRGVPA